LKGTIHRSVRLFGECDGHGFAAVVNTHDEETEMNTTRTVFSRLATAAAVSAALLSAPATAFAHCDGLDGPVVKAARQALDGGNPNLVLVWVQKKDEAEIKHAFHKTVAVRKLNSEAKELADHYFFETLVRVHRAGEGAPYTGLKPAGRDLGPAIMAGDKALETGSVEPVVKLLTDDVQKSIRAQFKEVMAKKNYNKDDVAAGQQYVKAYVEYIHSVEKISEAAKKPAHGHMPEPAAAAHQH
jgi:hypothetical protein